MNILLWLSDCVDDNGDGGGVVGRRGSLSELHFLAGASKTNGFDGFHHFQGSLSFPSYFEIFPNRQQ